MTDHAATASPVAAVGRAAPPRGSSLTRQRVRAAWTFLLPMIVVLSLVAGWPLLSTVYLSFTNAFLGGTAEARFVGFQNYAFYGPNLRDWDDEFGGFFVTYESVETGAAVDLLYEPDSRVFFDFDTEEDIDNFDTSQTVSYLADDGRWILVPLDGGTGATALSPYEGEIDTSAVFSWQGVLADAQWWRSVWNTIWFSVISVTLELVLGLAIALILNANMPGRGLLRAAVLIPWAIPTIVSAQMWGWMLNDQYGVINEIMLWAGLISERMAWTANPSTALPAVIAVDVWKTTPFMALLILAALQLLPGEIYEAGKVDGIHPVRMFFKVTLPLIRPAVMVAVIFRALDALRIFDLIYVLTSNSRDTMSMSIYARQQLVDFQNVGFGSAASTVLFVIIATFTVLYIVLGKVNFDGGR